MKISELQELLETVKKEIGDVDVRWDDRGVYKPIRVVEDKIITHWAWSNNKDVMDSYACDPFICIG